MIIKNKRAITLVEIMVTVLIVTAIMGVLYGAFVVGNESWKSYTANITMQREAQGALFAMVRELREARNILITKDPTSVTIRFTRSPLGLVSYVWSNSGDNPYKIIRQHNANTRILANNISSLSLTYETNNAILVDITATDASPAGGSADFNLRGKVALRSKVGVFR